MLHPVPELIALIYHYAGIYIVFSCERLQDMGFDQAMGHIYSTIGCQLLKFLCVFVTTYS
jgi:hypothetical protein